MLTKEELIKIGVNPENLKHPMGELNIIVQNFGFSDREIKENEIDIKTITEMRPDIYHPRKNSVWSCACLGYNVAFSTDEDKKKFVIHLRDSAERLKIMSHLLMKQAEEIEKFGYPKTTCYFPE